MVCFNRDYHFVFISFLEMILTANGHLVVCVYRANHFLFIYFSFPIAMREMIPCRICYCLLGLTNQIRMFQTVRPIKCLLSNACVKNLAPSFTQFTHSNQRTLSAWLCMNCGYLIFNLIMLLNVYGDYDLHVYYKGKVHFASSNHIFKVKYLLLK